MYQNSINNIARKMANRSTGIPVYATIVDYEVLGDKGARIVAQLSKRDFRSVGEVFSAKFNHELSMVEGSMVELSDIHSETPLVRFHAVPNRVSKEYDEKGMRVLSSNLLMDQEDETLWDVEVSDSGVKYLCRRSSAEFASMLHDAKQRRVDVLKTGLNLPVARTNDFVAAVDLDNSTVVAGLAVVGEAVSIQTLEGDVFHTDLHNVVSSAAVDDEMLKEVSEFEEIPSEDEMLAFYKKVYGESPEFYNKLAQIIRDNSVA